MRAVQLVSWQADPELRDVAVPEPGPGEVLVEVAGAGLCHSDLHLMEWPEGTFPWRLPFTLGHETAGTVAALGRGAGGFAEGDRVLVYGPWGCGSCVHCVRGAENLCLHRFGRPGAGCGLGYDGGLADYVLVPSARLLVPLGDLDPVEAAPLTDAALTPYHALKPELPRLVPGSSAVVIGVGGLGSVAVQLLRALSPARVVAIDLREASRALALRFGAHVALDARDLTPADLREELGGGATVVLDFVGNDETLALAAGTIEIGGHVALVGLGGGSFPMTFGSVPLEWSLRRPSWGTLPELHEVVALARSGALELAIERLSLDEAVDGYHRLHAGEFNGRAVVVP
ncbi:MAG: NAD(P)-dependent alcohol dehydrogenase [Thermoleophilia bacterium]|nr:NAD(P)-dependent alcohol dehydrogenase [Thermoleophilia bacterium]